MPSGGERSRVGCGHSLCTNRVLADERCGGRGGGEETLGVGKEGVIEGRGDVRGNGGREGNEAEDEGGEEQVRVRWKRGQRR
eukprot:758845-Hanusia_phi.AAC.1